MPTKKGFKAGTEQDHLDGLDTEGTGEGERDGLALRVDGASAMGEDEEDRVWQPAWDLDNEDDPWPGLGRYF
jgi:hypothetical protein